eukprot:3687885-Amphidinium_carterae.1
MQQGHHWEAGRLIHFQCRYSSDNPRAPELNRELCLENFAAVAALGNRRVFILGDWNFAPDDFPIDLLQGGQVSPSRPLSTVTYTYPMAWLCWQEINKPWKCRIYRIEKYLRPLTRLHPFVLNVLLYEQDGFEKHIWPPVRAPRQRHVSNGFSRRPKPKTQASASSVAGVPSALADVESSQGIGLAEDTLSDDDALD